MEELADFNLLSMSNLESNPKTWISQNVNLLKNRAKMLERNKMIMEDVSQQIPRLFLPLLCINF